MLVRGVTSAGLISLPLLRELTKRISAPRTSRQSGARVQKLSSLQPYSFIVCTTTTKRRAKRWNRSLTSEQDTWNKLLRSNFLNTLPLSSTKLLLIMIVRRALLLALIATLRVVA